MNVEIRLCYNKNVELFLKSYFTRRNLLMKSNNL